MLSELFECVDCGERNLTVVFDEDNQALMCSDCIIELDLVDWLEYVMMEYAPLSWW